MENKKEWLPHLITRLLAFPVVFGIVYLIIRLIDPQEFLESDGIRVSFFTAAALIALSLMAETLLLFGKKRVAKALCNIFSVFIIILFVIILAPYLYYL